MSSRLRLVAASLIVALAATGGAMFVERSTAANAAAARIAAVGAGDLAFRGGDASKQMLDQTIARVEDSYYKPVAVDTLLQGEHRGLVALLKARRVANPQVPLLAETGVRAHDLALLGESITRAAQRYPKTASRSELTEAAIVGMLGALGDPYTTYLSKREMDALQEELKGGDFGGIGVFIVQDFKTKEIVVDPIEGNPAIRAGIRRGDIITSVNGHTTHGLKIDDVERLIRGEVGTVVALTVREHTSHRQRTIRVTRSDVHVPSVKAKIEDGVEYIRLADFGQTSGAEVRAALENGKANHVRGYILDLRNNGGGLLDAAVDVSSLVIGKGPIVSTIDRAGNRDVKSALGHPLTGISPLVVLVNQFTASASEITAGAIQDDHLGTLVGVKTYGKGVVQSLYYISDGSALKITTARYVTPLGRDIHHRGIRPDVVINQRIDQPIIDTRSDKQLAAAKRIVLEKAKE